MKCFFIKKAFPELLGTVFGLFVLSFTKANLWPIFGPILQPNYVPYGRQFVTHMATNFECNNEMKSSILILNYC
jgi:hypothetical protein